MTIAEKYAAQWMPNGEVSLADLIQAAVDEAQSVPVVGEVVAWVRRHPDGALTAEFLEDAVIEPVRRNSGGWLPLYAAPTHSIPTAELASLREKAAQLETVALSRCADRIKLSRLEQERDELRKDAERYRWLRDSPESPILNVGYATDKVVDAAIAQGKVCGDERACVNCYTGIGECIAQEGE